MLRIFVVKCECQRAGGHAKNRLDTSVEAADTSVCATRFDQLALLNNSAG